MNPIDQSTLTLAYTHFSRPPDAHIVLRSTQFYVVVNNVWVAVKGYSSFI